MNLKGGLNWSFPAIDGWHDQALVNWGHTDDELFIHPRRQVSGSMLVCSMAPSREVVLFGIANALPDSLKSSLNLSNIAQMSIRIHFSSPLIQSDGIAGAFAS